MTRSSNHSRGFAMIMALVMLGLVAITLIVLARYFAYEHTRTRTVTGDAQLSQLLLAGARDVAEHAKSWGVTARAETWQLELPKSLVSDGAKVAISARPAEDGSVLVNIDAQVESQRGAETLRLRHADSGWSFASVEMAGADS